MFDTSDYKLLLELLTKLPNPAQLYMPNGDMIMANQAFIDEFKISDVDELFNKYNIINDPTVKGTPFYDKILEAFSGVVTQSKDVVIPIHIVKSANKIRGVEVETFIADISTIPVFENDKLVYVVNLLYLKRKLANRREIELGKAYIETHWFDKFDIKSVARKVYLSESYFSHIFKTHTGMTPHEYYIDIKIEKIKHKLLDRDISVEDAFSKCGVDYHGYYAGLFKKKTGFSPSEYRRIALK